MQHPLLPWPVHSLNSPLTLLPHRILRYLIPFISIHFLLSRVFRLQRSPLTLFCLSQRPEGPIPFLALFPGSPISAPIGALTQRDLVNALSSRLATLIFLALCTFLPPHPNHVDHD